eukprot:gene2582-3544_t
MNFTGVKNILSATKEKISDIYHDFMAWYSSSGFIKFLNFLIFFITPLIACVSLTMGAFSFFTLFGDVEDLQNIVSNWKLNPIKEIRFVDSNVCPDDFSYLNTTWPGTLDHCDCRKIGQTIRLGPCFAWEDKCTFRKGIKPKELNRWRNKTICVQRYKNESALERPFPVMTNASTNCTQNRRLCGGGNISNQTCILKMQKECPVNYMIVSDQREPKYWPIDEKFNLNYDTSRNFLPIVDLIQTEGHPCKSGIPGSSARKRIPMRDWIEPKLCYIPDTRYQEFDSMSEMEFLVENGVPKDHILEDASNVTWKFSYRNEIPWKYDCEITREYIVENIGTIDMVKLLQFILFICTLFGSVILSCCLPCFEISQGRLYFILCPQKLNIKKEIRLIKADICGSFCQIFCNSLTFIPVFVTILYSLILIRFYSHLRIFSCSDNLSNITSRSLAIKLERSTSFFNLLIIILDVVLTIKAIIFLFSSCLLLKEKQREKRLFEQYMEI